MTSIMAENNIPDQWYTALPTRGLIHIEGKDRHSFLQGLVTNDINTLTPGKAIYGCLLNAQGKFLHDFFIYEIGETVFLECEGGERTHDLYTRLNMYRLRSDVRISFDEQTPVYAVKGKIENNLLGYKDPRHDSLGYRALEKPPTISEAPFDTWDRLRITLCIPDGSRDLIIGQSTMAEGRIDELNGIAYDKGCYVGQELTARMHYRGLAKKHLYTVTPEKLGLNALPKTGDSIFLKEKKAGEMRSKCGNIGLALLKDSLVNH